MTACAGQHHDAWLVLGPVHLIHGTAQLADDDVIGLVAVAPLAPAASSNTITMSWAKLGLCSVSVGTVSGERQAAANLTKLFDAGVPSLRLERLIDQVVVASAKSTCVPLFYIAVEPEAGGFAVHVYSQIRFPGPDACFLRIAEPEPLHTPSVEGLDWLSVALELHREHAQFLNTHRRRSAAEGQRPA